MSKLKVHLLLIDPQNDFCDIPDALLPRVNGVIINRPALPVPGAHADMGRIAGLIRRIGPKVTDIHVTMDSHRVIDVAHPALWMDQNGNPPAPFTMISASDVEASIWTPRSPALRPRMLAYTKALAATGKYVLIIWPPHCLIGTWGAAVHEDVNKALQEWSSLRLGMVDYVAKGSNPWTEHYGALMAEVPDPTDPSTGLNTGVLTMLAEADIVGVMSEASSHCVMTTVNQIVDNIGAQHLPKFHLVTDCMSPVAAVPGMDFPAIAKAWMHEMNSNHGMPLTTADAFLA